jgi:hypothetical protein
MATSVTITHPSVNSGVAVTVKGRQILPSGKRNIIAKPKANMGTQARAQIQSAENLRYVISGVHFTGTAGQLSYTDILTLYRSTTLATLTVTYGKTGSTSTLKGFDGSTTAIQVALESFNFNIDMSDSKEGYMPTATLTFVESA